MNSLLLLQAAIIAFLPIIEVRGAIPLVVFTASTPGEFYLGVILSVISNMLIPLVAFRLLEYLDYVVNHERTPHSLKRLYSWLLTLGRKRASKLRTGSYVALALFVGLPFPATGAWTGTLVAFVLGMNKRKATLCIILGVLIASFIVLLASVLGLEVLKMLFLL
ncbi:MAG: small multi-drug export protein [Desulfurococcaceae archaeon]